MLDALDPGERFVVVLGEFFAQLLDQRDDLRDLAFRGLLLFLQRLDRVLREHHVLAALEYLDLEALRLGHQLGRVLLRGLPHLRVDDHEEQDDGAETAAHAVEERHAEDLERPALTSHRRAPS